MQVTDISGNTISTGDTIYFAYGIPGVGVHASVVDIKGVLWVLTPGHKPEKIKLSELEKHVGQFWKTKNGRLLKEREKPLKGENNG